MQTSGQKFTIEREGIATAELDGLSNHDKRGRRYVGFYPNADVQPKDWIIDSSGKRYYVLDTEVTSFQKKPHQLKAYTLTDVEYSEKGQKRGSPVFNIENAYGSVIGTQAMVTLNYSDCISHARTQIEESDSEDREDLTKLIDLLEMIVNNQVPPQKGIFSKFTEVIQRNSWVTGSVTSALMTWLLSHAT